MEVEVTAKNIANNPNNQWAHQRTKNHDHTKEAYLVFDPLNVELEGNKLTVQKNWDFIGFVSFGYIISRKVVKCSINELI